MKKVLFATTALVATAGVAAADVTFGGYGRFGIEYIDDDATGDDSTNVTSRFRLQIEATAESDAGVTFGARVRLQGNEGTDAAGDPTADVADFNGTRLFARSGGIEVGVGNIFGVLESMKSSYPVDLGLTGLGYDYTPYQFGGDGYSSSGTGAYGSNGVEVTYTAGDLYFHVSASDVNDRIAASARYTFSGWTVEAAVQDSDDAGDTEYALGILGTIGPVDLSLGYSDNGTNGDRIVLAGRYEIGAATDMEAYIVDQEFNDDLGYGIDFNHSLGGGTSIRGGIVRRLNGNTQADLGVRFDF